jgi:hypothetical protein
MQVFTLTTSQINNEETTFTYCQDCSIILVFGSHAKELVATELEFDDGCNRCGATILADVGPPAR